MEKLTSNFNRAYPDMPSSPFIGSCDVEEPSNVGKDAFQKLTLTGFDGYGFPHAIVAQTTSFASCAQNSLASNDPLTVMRCDCDKVIFFEREGQKYVLFCELKSTFSTDEIAHAKDQIVGSWVKMQSLLHSLQGFAAEDYKPLGLIVSFAPTIEQLDAVSKNYDRKSMFAIMLNTNKKYQMPACNTDKYFYPLRVGAIDLFYLPVPDRQKTFTVNINTII